jgi:DNA repair exonuclease SbcCD ATPase subunit
MSFDDISEIHDAVSSRRYKEEITSLKEQLETERLRLAACGVAALGYFDGCKDEYRSASLEDTLRLYAKNQELKAQLAEANRNLKEFGELYIERGEQLAECKKELSEMTMRVDENTLDAIRWREYQARKARLIEAGFGKSPLRDAAISQKEEA